MKIVTLILTSDLTVETDTQYNEIASQNVIVQKDVIARIYGVISNSLIVKKGATVYLFGPKPRHIINEGGEVYIYDTDSGGITTY